MFSLRYFIICSFNLTGPEKKMVSKYLTFLHSEQPKLHRHLAVLSAIGFMEF